MTSYGYCCNLKNERCPMLSMLSMLSVFRLWGRGGVFCEMLGWVVPPGHWNRALASTAVHTCTHTAYTIGVTPPGFEVFCIRECGSTSNALFCVCEVWQDFIRVVGLCLLSRSTNFRSSKHKTDLPISGFVWTERRGRMKTFSLPHVSIEGISSYFVELTLLRSLINSERNNI